MKKTIIKITEEESKAEDLGSSSMNSKTGDIETSTSSKSKSHEHSRAAGGLYTNNKTKSSSSEGDSSIPTKATAQTSHDSKLYNKSQLEEHESQDSVVVENKNKNNNKKIVEHRIKIK